jgi:tetratricopeptide (TPR) repeat protein
VFNPGEKKNSRSASQTVQAAGLTVWFIPLFISLLTFIVFLPVLQNGFVDLDDDKNILGNPHYRGLAWTQLRWMFTTFHLGHYQPLSWVTLGLDYLLWGMNPFGYHLTNLLLHAANAVVFYFLCVRLLSLAISASPRDLALQVGAGVAAVLFAVHPLRVESVAWVTERRDVLSGLFFLLTILCYARGATAETGRGHLRWMAWAVVVYALSLLSKAVGMTLPVVLLALDVYPLRRLGGGQGRWFGPQVRKVWWEKIPFLLLALGTMVVAFLAQYHEGIMESLAHWGLVPRLAQAFYGLVFYLWKTLIPVGLLPLYELPARLNPGDWPYLVSATVVLGLSVALVIIRERWPAGLAVWVYYVAMVAPVSGIAQSGPQLVADRYSYLSCLGWVILVGGGLVLVRRCWLTGSRLFFNLAAVGVVAIVAVLSYQTRQQIQVWHDTERLCKYILSVTPESRIAHANLGNVLYRRGNFEEAIEHYRRSIRLGADYADRNYAVAHFNLGNVLDDLGRLDEAREHYRKAVEIDPGFVAAHNNLGLVLVKRGKLEEAIQHYRRALEVNPAFALAHVNLGDALVTQGQIDEAVRHYRQAIQIEPTLLTNPIILTKIGTILHERGDFEGAIRYYRQVIQIGPSLNPRTLIRAHLELGRILRERGDIAEADQHFREADRIISIIYPAEEESPREKNNTKQTIRE